MRRTERVERFPSRVVLQSAGGSSIDGVWQVIDSYSNYIDGKIRVVRVTLVLEKREGK